MANERPLVQKPLVLHANNRNLMPPWKSNHLKPQDYLNIGYSFESDCGKVEGVGSEV